MLLSNSKPTNPALIYDTQEKLLEFQKLQKIGLPSESNTINALSSTKIHLNYLVSEYDNGECFNNPLMKGFKLSATRIKITPTLII